MQAYKSYLDLKKRLDQEFELEKLRIFDAVSSEV